MQMNQNLNKVIGNTITVVKWKHNLQFAAFGALGALVSTSNLFVLIIAALVAYIAAGCIDMGSLLIKPRE